MTVWSASDKLGCSIHRGCLVFLLINSDTRYAREKSLLRCNMLWLFCCSKGAVCRCRGLTTLH